MSPIAALSLSTESMENETCHGQTKGPVIVPGCVTAIGKASVLCHSATTCAEF